MSFDPGFVEPRYLFLAPLLLAVFSLFVTFRRRARTTACALLRLPPPAATRGWGLVLVVALLSLSLARPYTGFQDRTVPTRGRDLAVLFDVSQSMLAHDESPTRLAFATRKLEDLISTVQSKSPGDRIALILFAGDSYLFSPLTADYAVLRHFARAISPQLITRGGSRIDRAIVVGLEALESAQATSGALLILSDGEDARDATPRLIDQLKSATVPLYALGFGSAEGSPIEYEPRRFIKDERGEIVVSKLNNTTLRALAEGSGGAYLHARNDESDVQTILSSITAIEQAAGRAGNVRQHDEVGAYFAFLALIILALCAALQPAWILLCGTLMLWPCLATATPSEEEAYQAYEAGRFDEAVAGFAAAAERDPANRELRQALASAYFKAGDSAKALNLFQELAESASTGRERFESLYNLGNAALAQRQPTQAIDAYTEALKIKPGDARTQHNLEIAQLLLRQPTPTPTPTPPPQSSPSSQPSPPSSPSGSPSPHPSDGPSSERSASSDESTGGEEQPPQPADHSPSDAPTPSASTAKNEPLADQPPSKEAQPQSEDASSSPPQNEEKLSERAARAWLESLPEAPLLLRRKNSQEDSVEGQTW